MKVHPIADVFWPMAERELEGLKQDIAQHGLREPIWIHEDQILDGRHRWEACQQLGITPPTRVYEGDDPLAFAISMNLKRRHLNEGQRAAIAAKIANLKHGGDRRSDQAANLPVEKTQAGAAELLKVSERSVRSANAVLKKGVPELVAAVEQDKVSVSTAEQVSDLPPDTQQQLVAAGPAAIQRAAKERRLAHGPRKGPHAGASRAQPPQIAAENARLKTANAALENEIREARAKLAELSIEVESLRARWSSAPTS